MEVALGVAARTLAVAVASIFPAEALDRRPRLDQRAVYREAIARQQPLHLRLGRHSCQELRSDLSLQQPVTVLGEGRVVPDCIIHADGRQTNGAADRTPAVPSVAAQSECRNACSSIARSSFSGAIEGRPKSVERGVNARDRSLSAAFAISRTPAANDRHERGPPNQRNRTAIQFARPSRASCSPDSIIKRIMTNSIPLETSSTAC